MIGAAVGGQDAGVVYEGDRRFDIVVRLPEGVRSDLGLEQSLPGQRCRRRRRARRCRACRSTASRSSPSPRGRTRSAAKTASAASSGDGQCPPAAISARVVEEVRDRVRRAIRCSCRRVLLDDRGRPVREPRRGAAAAWPSCVAGLLCDRSSCCCWRRWVRRATRPCSWCSVRAAAGVDRRHRGAAAARHAVLDLGGGRLHRAVRRRGAERAR